MATNPNYPVIQELWGPAWTAQGGSFPSTLTVNLIDRTLSQANARRGKQYELDQPQSGEYQITLGSQDGVLDPTNSGGPYASRILPYQPYRRRAQWPPTANMLDPWIATGGEGTAAGPIPASWGILSSTDASNGSIAVPSGSLTAYQGTNTFRFAVPSGKATNSRIAYFDGLSIRPGATYTVSFKVRCITDSVNPNVGALIGFCDATAANFTWTYGSTPVLTGSSTVNGWTTVSVTATAPTTGNVYGMRIGLRLGAAAPGACTIETDAWQLEYASSASTWVSPGTWYPLFTGFTERWPTQWADGGTYGQVSPTAVDAFALLSQVALKEIFLEEIQSHNPRFCYALADASGSTSFADSTGNFPAAPLTYAKAGTGNWTSGNSITSASASGGVAGSTGTVVTAGPLSPGTSAPAPATVLDLTGATVKGPATTAWTRMLAFRTGTLPPDGMTLWETRTSPGTDTSFDGHCRITIGNDGWLRILANTRNTDASFGSQVLKNSSVADGNWHLLVFGFDGTNMRYSMDGVTSTTTWSSQPTLSNPVDVIGATWFPTTKVANDVFKGDLAFVTEFPSLLSATDMGALYTAWRTAAVGESSAARYARILRYSGYTGASSIGTGLTTSMGPATDIGGTDVMSALNAVVETENGEHFVAADGTVTFRGRNARYNALTPALTFGDGPGELPFEDLQLDFDSTHLANVATITQTTTGTAFVAQDSASIAAYYERNMTRSLNTTSATECQDAADYLVSRYKQPLTRVQSIKLHPSAATSLWPSLLALELGTRVRINRRPPGAPTVTVDCFVEQITWDQDSNNEAWVTLQCSPIDPVTYAQFSDTLPQFDQASFAY
ncbi:hypothetical protein AB0958_21840 [Streptomyces sp. NPDC006655]|uniref:hypothetical protein n=1 Tax=Streptomyces sp. NPDC006655 TaxID=3156898 RepID=UPI0034535D80